jgi:hypothetical protein
MFYKTAISAPFKHKIMSYTKEKFKERLDYLSKQEESIGLNCYQSGRFEMAKDCKDLIFMQSLPKRCSNSAFVNAREMMYADFIVWWNEQV